MYTWITTSSGRSSMSFMPGFSTCSSVMVTSSLSSRYAARVASPNGGNREYLIGRNSGLVASVSAGRIIFTLMPRGYNGVLYIAKYSEGLARDSFPLLSRGGESRRGSGGWGGAGQENHLLANTTPSARAKVASQLFLCRAATPPRLRRGSAVRTLGNSPVSLGKTERRTQRRRRDRGAPSMFSSSEVKVVHPT